jgi:hypothetical protein
MVPFVLAGGLCRPPTVMLQCWRLLSRRPTLLAVDSCTRQHANLLVSEQIVSGLVCYGRPDARVARSGPHIPPSLSLLHSHRCSVAHLPHFFSLRTGSLLAPTMHISLAGWQAHCRLTCLPLPSSPRSLPTAATRTSEVGQSVCRRLVACPP